MIMASKGISQLSTSTINTNEILTSNNLFAAKKLFLLSINDLAEKASEEFSAGMV
jgi:hypothetical protein